MAKKTRAARQSTVPADETKAQKFVRLAEARVTKAVKTLRNIAKLGGNNYERTAEQQKKIVDLLTAEVEAVKKALTPHVPGAKKEKGEEGSIIKL